MELPIEKLAKREFTFLLKQKQRLYKDWKNSGIIADDSLLKAFLEVLRELFVEPCYRDQSYADHPLPIGSGQTISQPTTVIMMLQLLAVIPGQRVLEIGSGSGYNAALLAKLVMPTGMIITLKRHKELVELAQKNLRSVDLEEVVVIEGDGKQGHEKLANFDRIIVTAATDQVPHNLKDQLAIGGSIVVPIGPITVVKCLN